MLPSPARWTLADIATLWQYVTGCSMLAGFSHAGIQRLLAILSCVLRRTDASVIRRFVSWRAVVVIFVIRFVIEIVVEVATRTGASYSRRFRCVLSLRPLRLRLDRGAMRALAPDDVHSPFVSAGVLSFALSLLRTASAFTAVAQILLEYRLAGRAVSAGQIRASVLATFLHPISFQHVLVLADMEIHRHPVDL